MPQEDDAGAESEIGGASQGQRAQVQHGDGLATIDEFPGGAHRRTGDLAQFHHGEHLDHARRLQRVTVGTDLEGEEEHGGE